MGTPLAPACRRRWRATPGPRHPAACGAGTFENPGTAAQAAHGQHSPVPKIPGIHRELPGPIHIAAIRQPASF
ncbi:MAG TPA: hypothetical protein VHO07_03185 [Streptosporangiaceae bacterium]|nr:hypothetical protein [Streptosporangiaceae bacterium]